MVFTAIDNRGMKVVYVTVCRRPETLPKLLGTTSPALLYSCVYYISPHPGLFQLALRQLSAYVHFRRPPPPFSRLGKFFPNSSQLWKSEIVTGERPAFGLKQPVGDPSVYIHLMEAGGEAGAAVAPAQKLEFLVPGAPHLQMGSRAIEMNGSKIVELNYLKNKLNPVTEPPNPSYCQWLTENS